MKRFATENSARAALVDRALRRSIWTF